ncbi:hypothetical protein [Providencia alcalifaciens]|uniref:hypothetical protein n=1 Tax=Providencia alcalifaciens TaxID=126385 RepID=UPI003D985BB4
MMSWKIPSLEHPPKPALPHFLLWLGLVVIISVLGFGLGLYLSSKEILPSTMNNNQIITFFVVFPVMILICIRLLAYSIAAYRHQLFTNMLDDAHREWRYWAGKHLGMLTHTRLTHIDEAQQEGNSLSSLPPNKENILTLNSLVSLPSWEKPVKIIQQLLEPIAAYTQKNTLTQPITLYWSSNDYDTDWTALLKHEAARLSLALESIAILPYKSFEEWLLALYENPFEPKLYAILAFQLDSTASQEASSLLLAPQGFYERLRAPLQAKLLRPISTDRESFADALKAQCEFQLKGEQLTSIWHSNISDSNKMECIQNYIQQNIRCLSEHFYDADTLLGISNLARYGVVLSLASESLQPVLVTHQNGDRLLLQQLLI